MIQYLLVTDHWIEHILPVIGVPDFTTLIRSFLIDRGRYDYCMVVLDGA